MDGIVLVRNNAARRNLLMYLVSSPMNEWLPDQQLFDFLVVPGVFLSYPVLMRTKQR